MGLWRRTTAALPLVLALLWSAAPARPQTADASLSGVITDPSGAVIPGATVTATDVARNLEYRTETDGSGRYVLTRLLPGSYRLTVEAPGFATRRISDLVLQVAQQATIDVELGVGAPTTVVEVTGVQPLVDTRTAELGQTVTDEHIISIPLMNREFMRLVFLSPGVVPPDNDPGLASMSNPTRFASSGVRAGTTDVYLDGAVLSSVEKNNAAGKFLEMKPAVETIQEFKVQTNFFSAEYGNTGGTVVNLATRSGTNELHGSVYEFHRRDDLNANSFFAKREGSTSLPNFNYHHFGGTAGGPVSMPGVYDGKNRTFFFTSMDVEWFDSPGSEFLTVPTLKERAGDFSDTRDSTGRLFTIYNPFDTYTDNKGQVRRRPFPGNVIPASLQDPVARKILSFYPEPTSEGLPLTHAQNYFKEGTQRDDQIQWTLRLDHQLTDRHRIYGRFAKERSRPGAKLFRIFGEDNPAESATKFVSHTHAFSTDYSFTQNATTIWSVRYSLARQRVLNVLADENFDPTTLGLPPVVLTNGFRRFPVVSVQGYSGLGASSQRGSRRATTTHTVAYSLSKIISGHTIKMGGESRWFLVNSAAWDAPTGLFQFNRQVTGENPFKASPIQGNGVASLLLGWGNGGRYGIQERPASGSQYHGWFIQDDWKLTRRLTLNLGLRYDFELPRTERYDRYSWFDFGLRSPIADQLPELNLRGGLAFTDEDRRSPFDKDTNNIQPRVGIAYAVSKDMSVRAGYGLYYTVSKTIATTAFGPPFAVSTPIPWSLDGGVTRYATLSNPWPDGLVFPTGKALGAATFLGLNLNTQSRPNRNPQVHQWAFSIQRALPATARLELNYTGTRGVHLYFPDLENVNRLHPTYWGLGRDALNATVTNPFYGVITDPTSVLSKPKVTFRQLLRPFPQYTGLSVSTPTIANSIYHALQVKLEKRPTHGLSVIAHYTWSKWIDDASNSGYDFFGGDSAVQNYWNLRLERSLSVSDVAHRAVASVVWELPFGRGRWLGKNWNRALDAVLGGWKIASLTTLQTGTPVVIGLFNGVLLEGAQRPHLVGDPEGPGSTREKLDGGYFNASAFLRPAEDTYGSAPRTLNYRNPGIVNTDMTLGKIFSIAERHRIELRMEAFNVFNGVVFGKPNASVEAPTFGVISNYASGFGPRQLQFGIRYEF